MRAIEWSASKDFTLDGFRTWLLAQPETSIVGLVAVASRCPLSCWITEMSGKSCVVGISSYRCPVWYDERPLPEWAWQFALLLRPCVHHRCTVTGHGWASSQKGTSSCDT